MYVNQKVLGWLYRLTYISRSPGKAFAYARAVAARVFRNFHEN